MTLLRYDESQLVTQIERLGAQRRVVFAASCAQRLLPAYVSFVREQAQGSPTELPKILEQLWRDLEGHAMTAGQLQDGIDRCTAAIPSEDNPAWTPARPYADDAASALVYALQARLNGSAQKAA